MNIKKLFNNKVSRFVSAVIDTDEAVIEKIHNEFETASDKALSEANAILSGIKNIPREKAELMRKLGFFNANEVHKADQQDAIIDRSRNRAEIINEYSEKYPQYKFIFWDQVEAICVKYNLLCGTSGLYKGDIPYKNLEEINNFKVEPEDRWYVNTNRREWGEDNYTVSSRHNWINEPKSSYTIAAGGGLVTREVYNSTVPFFICAPEKDMDTEGYKKSGTFLERNIPDPIVLHPMPDGALIVSKWGLEADDEILK